MMKWYGRVIVFLVVAAATADIVRYMQGDSQNKQKVWLQNAVPPSRIEELIFVYNANGGIYPGIADFLHKELFPSSYPCNLCYQTFGTFIMKKEWKVYLARLPYQKTFLHKDGFKRLYSSENLPLPAILAAGDKQVWVLLSATEINSAKSLNDIIRLLNGKLTP